MGLEDEGMQSENNISIDWERGEDETIGYTWANNCTFSDENILGRWNQWENSGCARLCNITQACSHYIYLLEEKSCVLHYGDASILDADFSNQFSCGYLDYQKSK